MNGYVDLYLLPVPERSIEAYREQAATFGAVAREHGALGYREVRADDLDTALREIRGWARSAV